MPELVDQAHVLNQGACRLAYDLHDVVFVELPPWDRPATATAARDAAQPESHVLVACWVFGEGNERGERVKGGELSQEARVGRPEETNVWNPEQQHRDAVETHAKRPAQLRRDARGDGEGLPYDAAAQQLQPGVLPVYFEFPRRACEGEVGLHPANFERFRGLCWKGGGRGELGFGEYVDDEGFEGAFKVRGDGFHFSQGVEGFLQGISLGVNRWVGILDLDLVLRHQCHFIAYSSCNVAPGNFPPVPHPRAFHLVENWVVAPIDGVAPVNVRADRIPLARIMTERIGLVGAGVGAQHSVFVDIVSVGAAAAGVVGGKVEGVEVLGYSYNGGKGVMVSVG